MKLLVLSLMAALNVELAARAEGSRSFLFLKTGERFATQEIAAPTVSGLTAYIGEKVAGTTNAFGCAISSAWPRYFSICSFQCVAISPVNSSFEESRIASTRVGKSS